MSYDQHRDIAADLAGCGNRIQTSRLEPGTIMFRNN
jgi:hypothetical protein